MKRLFLYLDIHIGLPVRTVFVSGFPLEYLHFFSLQNVLR